MEQLWKNLANPRSSVADPPLFRRDENGGCRTRVSACFDLESHFNRSPELLGPEEIRSYQVYLTNERKLAPSSIILAVAALRFLYKITLHKDWSLTEVIPTPQETPEAANCPQSGRSSAVFGLCVEYQASHDPDHLLRGRAARLGGCLSEGQRYR